MRLRIVSLALLVGTVCVGQQPTVPASSLTAITGMGIMDENHRDCETREAVTQGM